jgi:hypothetical protein
MQYKTFRAMTKLFLAGALASSMMLATDKSPIRELIEDDGIDKLKKSMVIDAAPTTAKGYDDGHGRNPYLTSETQLPDTLALITYYIYDKGAEVKGGYYLYSYSLSEFGGNFVANGLHKETIDKLKEKYLSMGIVLLTPDQYLDTEEKKTYYNTFQPKISKLGSFLSGIETKGVDASVTADFYRGFDISGATDHERMESLGYDLCNKLNVDGVLSIAFELTSGPKEVNMNGFKMAIHAPNPIAKQDKKYVSQNMGAGYYKGQEFAGGYFYFKKGMHIADVEKKAIVNEQYDGVADLLGAFAEKMQDEMKAAIAKNSK